LKHFVPALLISIALSSFNAGVAFAVPAANQSKGSDAQTHPVVMQQAAGEVATAPTGALQPFRQAARSAAVGGPGGLQREVFGFALFSSLADPAIGYPSWNFNLLTTVAVFGLHVNDNGEFANDSGWAVWNSSQMAGLLSKAHASGTKVVVTVILQDFSAGTPHMCAGLANRAITVSRTVAQVAAKGIDGVNLDYEGLNGTCPNQPSPRAMMTDLAHQMRVGLGAGSYLSVDTYASSAGDPSGFFDVPGINAYADAFFVMAYDSDWSNYRSAPLNCARYCLSPVSPLTGYFYNDTRAASEYKAAVPAGKVILGLPYYSRGSCTGSWAPNSYPAPGSSIWALSYRGSAGMATDATNTGYALHRDAYDGVTSWSTWYSNNTSCRAMEMYWDDVTSLSLKYDLVNRTGLRGVGLWNLNLGGGSPELWGALSTYFSCPVTLNVPTSPTSTEFNVSIDAGGCSVAKFDVLQYDITLSQGYYTLSQVTQAGSSGTAVAEGYPGYSYQFIVRAHSAAGVVGPWTAANVTVAAGATSPHPFKGLYTLDGYGGLHAADSPPLINGAYWPGWNIAKTAKASPGGPQSGFVLDGYGGLHPYGAPGLSETSNAAAHRWNWDIARDFAFLSDGSGGVVLDGYGGLHAFLLNGSTRTIQLTASARWNWDIARKLVIFPDMSGGYVLDGWGNLHPFGINGLVPAAAASVSVSAYWPGWDIAHDLVLFPGNGNESGYVMDGYGGLHPFHPASDASVLPGPIQGARWGSDMARSVWLLPGSGSAGYTMDGWGGFHPFGGAPGIVSAAFWPNWDIAKAASGG
jgi:spore germination protein YaaH